MKFQVAVAVLCSGSFVCANSGIFSPDGTVVHPPAVRSFESKSVGGALQRKETSFERLRRGLPPLPLSDVRLSTFREPLPFLARRLLGYIALTQSDGTAAGYISNTFDGQNSYTLTTSLTNALTVYLPSTSPFGGPTDIITINGPDTAHPYLGAVGGSGGSQFGQGQSDYTYLAATGGNSPPSSSTGTSLETVGYDGPAEIQICKSLDRALLRFHVLKRTTRAAQPATTIFYDSVVDSLDLTSDFGAFNDVCSEGAYTVALAFVPL
ncbi:hypothetical protein DFH07DRAFT_971800 [Mycena maculata]|uniref:Uncharacterized protein n=1 Tax=Mycena maculata TaxID=230809 RepID=A0AAD7HKF1_9AGAR|nr:hypothetical protein DFH07DRAFT_971800 [Mycena maculata]